MVVFFLYILTQFAWAEQPMGQPFQVRSEKNPDLLLLRVKVVDPSTGCSAYVDRYRYNIFILNCKKKIRTVNVILTLKDGDRVYEIDYPAVPVRRLSNKYASNYN